MCKHKDSIFMDIVRPGIAMSQENHLHAFSSHAGWQGVRSCPWCKLFSHQGCIPTLWSLLTWGSQNRCPPGPFSSRGSVLCAEGSVVLGVPWITWSQCPKTLSASSSSSPFVLSGTQHGRAEWSNIPENFRGWDQKGHGKGGVDSPGMHDVRSHWSHLLYQSHPLLLKK